MMEWLAERGRLLGTGPDLEASRGSLEDPVLHDEFLHALRLFLDTHDHDGRDPPVIAH
ncbi:hypothetical protein [[Pseudopropionibacterium] massiliense]|uniref:hypothetical protein n=1 Tax=[Pseudopropionibacterium] massiliense TaxID=2220000 RepID=UPI0013EF20EA|nr:hypothetical protein [[Pseudopropionibacterium] massiliense]